MGSGVATKKPGRGQGIRVREVTRARLLATAEDVFWSRGYAATSVDVIAEQAGYTTGAVYSNFGGKADLFLAVLEQASAAELAAVRTALDEATTDEQRLSVFTTTITRDPSTWQARVAATIEFLSHARHQPELHERMRDAQRLADEAAGELMSALCSALGVEPPVSTDEITRDVGALINGLAIRSLFDDDLDLPRAISTGVNSLLTGDRSDLRELQGARRAR
jgi:AcrR family transcriptional regulator